MTGNLESNVPERGTPGDPIVALRGIRKSFGQVEVLHGVDFDVRAGEVHVLAGENGAGKSTLIKILSGVYDDYDGDVLLRGRRERFSHPKEAVAAGIATIHQELSLVPSMSVSDNLFLGSETVDRLGRVRFAQQAAESSRLLHDMGLAYGPHQLVAELPISGQQLLEIARALARDAAVLVFDEPTSALSEHEVEFLFARIADLRRQGRGIVYITHRMDEIYRLADRITVLRDGALVGTAEPADLPADRLVRWMVGRDVAPQEMERREASDDVVLEVRDLRVAHPDVEDRAVFDGVSFEVWRGEIVGLAGLQGSGASEVLHALFGALGARASGTVRVAGASWDLRGPVEAIERGIMLLTNDRKAAGIAPELSVLHNASLASLSRFCGTLGWVRRDEEYHAVRDLTGEFRLRAHSLDVPARTLSGGNQQKLYLARCLLTEPKLLMLDEPTRGIDVGAKADIYELVRTWAARGIAMLLITSEMDELLTLSDRVLVMHRGRIAAALGREA
ncbi:MAG: sugar ABC transporter ATP-binding protein, partial [Gemmatimonadales bacterium]